MEISDLPESLVEKIRSTLEVTPELRNYLESNDPCYQIFSILELLEINVRLAYSIYLGKHDELYRERALGMGAAFWESSKQTGQIIPSTGINQQYVWLEEDAQAEYIADLAEFAKTAHKVPELSIRYASLNESLSEIERFEALVEMIPALKKQYEKRVLCRILKK